MNETNGLEEHFKSKDDYDRAHRLAGEYQEIRDMRKHVFVDGTSEAIAAAAAKSREIEAKLNEYRAKEKLALEKSSQVYKEHSSELMLQALEDYRQHLLEQGQEAQDEAEQVQQRIAALQQNTASLEKVVETPDL